MAARLTIFFVFYNSLVSLRARKQLTFLAIFGIQAAAVLAMILLIYITIHNVSEFAIKTVCSGKIFADFALFGSYDRISEICELQTFSQPIHNWNQSLPTFRSSYSLCESFFTSLSHSTIERLRSSLIFVECSNSSSSSTHASRRTLSE